MHDFPGIKTRANPWKGRPGRFQDCSSPAPRSGSASASRSQRPAGLEEVRGGWEGERGSQTSLNLSGPTYRGGGLPSQGSADTRMTPLPRVHSAHGRANCAPSAKARTSPRPANRHYPGGHSRSYTGKRNTQWVFWKGGGELRVSGKRKGKGRNRFISNSLSALLSFTPSSDSLLASRRACRRERRLPAEKRERRS